MDTPKYLYHYTSLETLALILENRTIAFNSLINVDDVEEAKAEDLVNIGKYVYVSCWTDVAEESIAMWNLYTPNMQGIRIKLPTFPFEKYHYEAGQFHSSESFDSYLDQEKLLQDNKCMIAPNLPDLVPITYTRDEKLIYPKARNGKQEEVQKYLSLTNMDTTDAQYHLSYSFSSLGKFKREAWGFQREWRYWMFLIPMGMKEMENLNPVEMFQKQQEIVRRLEDENNPAPYERILLKLDEKCLNQMEIVLGPRTTDAGRILAHALLEKHGLKQNCRDSALRIR